MVSAAVYQKQTQDSHDAANTRTKKVCRFLKKSHFSELLTGMQRNDRFNIQITIYRCMYFASIASIDHYKK